MDRLEQVFPMTIAFPVAIFIWVAVAFALTCVIVHRLDEYHEAEMRKSFEEC